MKRCGWCKKALSGRQRRFCSTNCRTTSAVKAWRRRTKERVVDLLGGRCSRCGYARCYAALILHHPGHKAFMISGAIKAWPTIRREVKKCILLCLNCHAEEHHSDLIRP